MGVDIGFYIQYKDREEGWKNAFLYKDDKYENVVGIWRCGWDNYDYVKYNFYLDVAEEDAVKLFNTVGWRDENNENEEIAPYHAISLSKLNYLANRPCVTSEENPENGVYEKAFFNELVTEIQNYLDFADYEHLDMDDIRIIAFASY